ncbi:MAG: ribosome maturation factor RimM [Hyphomonadaceae bacterium]
MSGDLVLVGAIEGAFGVQGEVRVKSFTADPESIAAYGPLLDANGKTVLTPKSWRAIKGSIALRAEEVKTREEAEALRNTPLHVPRGRLPKEEEDEFYVVDLIGCAVLSKSGEPLGDVIAVENFGAGDVIEVKAENGARFFLPFTKDAIPEIDLKARRLVADPPEVIEGDEAP